MGTCSPKIGNSASSIASGRVPRDCCFGEIPRAQPPTHALSVSVEATELIYANRSRLKAAGGPGLQEIDAPMRTPRSGLGGIGRSIFTALAFGVARFTIRSVTGRSG